MAIKLPLMAINGHFLLHIVLVTFNCHFPQIRKVFISMLFGISANVHDPQKPLPSAADSFNLDAAGWLAGWLDGWMTGWLSAWIFMDFVGFSWIWCYNALLGTWRTLRGNLLPL